MAEGKGEKALSKRMQLRRKLLKKTIAGRHLLYLKVVHKSSRSLIFILHAPFNSFSPLEGLMVVEERRLFLHDDMSPRKAMGVYFLSFGSSQSC